MNRNISSHIFYSILIAVVCFTVTHSLLHKPFGFDDHITGWGIRMVIYALFAWWVLHLSREEGIPEIGWLAIVVPCIAVLLKGEQYMTFDRLFFGIVTKKAVCFASLLLALGFTLRFFFLKNKTVLGFLIIVNSIITIFTFLPYGIPRIVFSMDSPVVTFPCYPYYAIDYTPFHNDHSNVSILLDIRFVTVAIFLVYLVIKCFANATRVKYADPLEQEVLTTKNPVGQFFKAGAYFFWSIIRRILFFSRKFFQEFFHSFIEEIKNSIESYIAVLFLFFTFGAPWLIYTVSDLLLVYNRSAGIEFSYVYHVMFLGTILLLFILPLLLIKLMKSEKEPFEWYEFEVSDRPALMLPVYVIVAGIGLATIVSAIMEKRLGVYLVLYIVLLLIVIIWGFVKQRRTTG